MDAAPALQVAVSEASPDPQFAIQTWRTAAGHPIAYGGRDARSCWMLWPGLATYRFNPNQPIVTAHPIHSDLALVNLTLITDTFRRSVLPQVLHTQGWEALHASAAVSGRGLVLFCAVSGTGKSTIAHALPSRGFPQWADDAVAIRTGNGVYSLPLPFDVRLRHDPAGARPSPPQTTTRSAGTTGQQHTAPLPIRAIVVLEREAVAPALCRLQAAPAFELLLKHAHEFDPTDRLRRARTVNAYLDVIESVRVYRLAFTPGTASVDALLDLIVSGLELEVPLAAEQIA